MMRRRMERARDRAHRSCSWYHRSERGRRQERRGSADVGASQLIVPYAEESQMALTIRFGKCAVLSMLLLAPSALARAAGPEDMTFFLTSAGLGKGADLGGLAGADAHCAAL